MPLPKLNPVEVPDLICTTCHGLMRRVIRRHPSKLQPVRVDYFCDTEKCQYGVTKSLSHANAQPCKYEPPEDVRTPEPIAQATTPDDNDTRDATAGIDAHLEKDMRISK